MMVAIGAVISAKVTRVESYGVWLEHQGEKVLVLVPELSWEPVKNTSEAVQIGQVLKVKVIRYNYPQHTIVGSVRALQPDKNPYRQLSLVDPDTPLKAKVVFVSGDHRVTVALPQNVLGDLSLDMDSPLLNPGDEVEVVISSLEVDEGRLVVRQIQPDQLRKSSDLVSAS